ncbi:hypothetical protein PR003_g16908 [Phytophthora rubi]|uniref:Uncharacterized protein n=1 Tax=Phytophthora rubi TaxID=129364 RepID=A0A6A3KFZ1_9STRA|nr:hypothetical protein PR002_g16517 [Phytophthora rubi]KAE9323708.1 hypothetical protein PR003_g16908 [Phytophthora rubi]
MVRLVDPRDDKAATAAEAMADQVLARNSPASERADFPP